MPSPAFRLCLVAAIVTLLACRESPTRATITSDPAPSCVCSCPSTAGTSTVASKPTSNAVPLDFPQSTETKDPFAPSVDVLAESPPLAVAIDASGNVTVDGTPAADDTAVLALIGAHDGGIPRAVISADAAVAHGKVIHLIDLLKVAGVTRIAFAGSKSP